MRDSNCRLNAPSRAANWITAAPSPLTSSAASSSDPNARPSARAQCFALPHHGANWAHELIQEKTLSKQVDAASLVAERADGLLSSRQDLVDLRLSDRQRRGHHEPLPKAAACGRACIQHDAVIETVDTEAARRAKLRRKPGFRNRVRNEFNREQQPLAAHVTDDRVSILEPLEPCPQLRTARSRVCAEIQPLEFVEHGQPDGTSDGIRVVGIAEVEPRGRG